MTEPCKKKAPESLSGDAGQNDQPQEVFSATAEKTTIAQANFYLRAGRKPIPLAQRSKQPTRSFNWKTDRVENESDVSRHFGGGNNVGLALGDRSGGLCDVDVDDPMASPLADALLADMPAFGRASRPRSHRLFCCKNAEKRIVFQLTPAEAEALSGDVSVIVELRGNGHYTMVPPSIHPSGEQVDFDRACPSTPPTKSWSDVERVCGLVAALTVIRRVYPQEAGNRDEVCMALTGGLLSAKIEPEEVDRLVELVAQAAGDEEAARRGNKAAATKEKLDAGEPCSGLPKLCELLGIDVLEKKLRKWFRAEDGSSVPSDAILIAPGRMQEIFEKSQEKLIDAGVHIYQRGAELMRPVVLNPRAVQADQEEAKSLCDGIAWESEATILLPVTTPYLLRQMSSSATYMRYAASGKLVLTDPKPMHATMIREGAGDWRFPVIRGIVSGPTLRPDLSLLQVPGYDAASQLILDTRGVQFAPVPDNPTKDDAVAALALFGPLFAGFPFVNKAAKAVAYSAVLTTVVRPALATAPLHAFDAPTPGTGKSKLAEIAGIVATGGKPPAIGQGSTVEEFEKRLSTLLRLGDPVVFIDNIERPLEGDFLCSALTQERVQCRILGKSERFEVPNTATILATGNNLVFAGDVTRRAVVCRIDAQVEKPDERQFDYDPTVIARQRRGELAVATLTAVRAYVVAGRPCPLPQMGSFESWNLVRETLVWLGHADPAETRISVYDSDTRSDTLAEMLRLWHGCLGEEPLSASAVGEACNSNTHDEPHRLLQAALIDITPCRDWNTKSVGWALRNCRDRIVGDLMLRRSGEDSQGALWQVVATDPSAKKQAERKANQTAVNEELPF